MARRPVVDREELFEAASRLESEGKPVTALALLEALGGGSLTTIYKYLAEWEASRPTAVATLADNEMPQGVMAAFAATWKVAAQEAARQVTAAKEKAAEEVKAAQQQFASALEAIDKLEKESEADSQTIETLKARVAELDGMLVKFQNDAAAFKATAEELRRQVKSQEAELERVHADLDKQRTKHEQEIERITQAMELANQKATEQIESLKNTLSTAKGKTDQLERELAEAQSKREEAQRQLEKTEASSKVDRAERDTALKEAAELRGQLNGLKTQNTELLAKIGKKEDKRQN